MVKVNVVATIYIVTIFALSWYNYRLSSISSIDAHDVAKSSLFDVQDRISVSFHNTYNSSHYTRFSHVSWYRCGDEDGKEKLHPELQKYFNITASIQTDLNILFMGDSISGQFAEAFDSAVLYDMRQEGVRATTTFLSGNPAMQWYHLCMSIASHIRGGGVSAFWRVTTLLNEETNQWPSKCQSDWRYWNEGQALALLNHKKQQTEIDAYRTQAEYLQEDISDRSNRVNEFDALILRVPHGWMAIDQINATRIIEAIEIANRILGARTIIITTLPLSNNVKTEDDWKAIANINHMIRQIARNFTESYDGVIKYVLVQEFGNLTNQVLVENAKNLGIMSLSNTTQYDYSKEGWEVQLADVFLQRPQTGGKWSSSYAQVCSRLPRTKEEEQCPGVKISPDGMHWCTETFGSRYVGSIACLLGCVYNVDDFSPSSQSVRDCEQSCNDQFMSLSLQSSE